MKIISIFILTVILSFKSLAQSTIIQPEVFQLHLSNNACPSAEYTGSIFYYTSTNLFSFCLGQNVFKTVGAGHWIGTTSIYRNSNVGIKTSTPLYELDITGNNRATDFYVGNKIGIGTTTPTEKVELVDREFAIKSTADVLNWRHRYLDATDRFEIAENNLSRLLINNGGNVGIGTYAFTPKLYVNGAVNFDSNLREGGFGTMASTATNVQQMITTTANISTNLSILANSCSTWGFSTGVGGVFTNTPAAFIGNNVSGFGADNHIVMTVENVSVNGGTVRFCNNSGTAKNLINIVYSIIMIGD